MSRFILLLFTLVLLLPLTASASDLEADFQKAVDMRRENQPVDGGEAWGVQSLEQPSATVDPATGQVTIEFRAVLREFYYAFLGQQQRPLPWIYRDGTCIGGGTQWLSETATRQSRTDEGGNRYEVKEYQCRFVDPEPFTAPGSRKYTVSLNGASVKDRRLQIITRESIQVDYTPDTSHLVPLSEEGIVTDPLVREFIDNGGATPQLLMDVLARKRVYEKEYIYPDEVGRITRMQGDIQIRKFGTDRYVSLKRNTSLRPGDTLKTGPTGTVSLLTKHGIVTLGSRSTMILAGITNIERKLAARQKEDTDRSIVHQGWLTEGEVRWANRVFADLAETKKQLQPIVSLFYAQGADSANYCTGIRSDAILTSREGQFSLALLDGHARILDPGRKQECSFAGPRLCRVNDGNLDAPAEFAHEQVLADFVTRYGDGGGENPVLPAEDRPGNSVTAAPLQEGVTGKGILQPEGTRFRFVAPRDGPWRITHLAKQRYRDDPSLGRVSGDIGESVRLRVFDASEKLLADNFSRGPLYRDHSSELASRPVQDDDYTRLVTRLTVTLTAGQAVAVELAPFTPKDAGRQFGVLVTPEKTPQNLYIKLAAGGTLLMFLLIFLVLGRSRKSSARIAGNEE